MMMTYHHDGGSEVVHLPQGLAVGRSWQASSAAAPGAVRGPLPVEPLLSRTGAMEGTLEAVDRPLTFNPHRPT